MRSVSVFLVCCEANCYRMMWCRAFSNPVMSALSFPNMVGHGIYTRWGIIFVIRIYRPGFESCPILLLCPTHTFSSCEFTVHLLCPTYCTGSRKMMLILPMIMIWYIYMIWYGLTLREKTTPLVTSLHLLLHYISSTMGTPKVSHLSLFYSQLVTW